MSGSEGPCGRQTRIVQIHPTRRCNLRCLHCYSLSSPGESEELSRPLLEDALTDASAEGYNVAGFSGGEPLLYPPLGEVLRHAKSRGMVTTVTSNGMLLEGRRLDAVAGCVDLIAISLDGVPASHNRMRASASAFDRMAANLAGLRERDMAFGFILTLTRDNLDELDWVAEFARSWDPLESTCRHASLSIL